MGSSNSSSGKRPWRRPRPGDVLYFSVLTSMMSASAAFPFYVHFHQDEFGPPLMEFYGALEKSEELQPTSPIYQRKMVAYVKPRLELDRLATGTIARTRGIAGTADKLLVPRQPFPDDEPAIAQRLEIMFVGAGRVLAVDAGRMVTLRPGSTLADGSRIEGIVKVDGGWNVTTSTGSIFSWSAGR